MLASRITILIVAVSVFMAVWVGLREAPRDSESVLPEIQTSQRNSRETLQQQTNDAFPGRQQAEQPQKVAVDVVALANSVPSSTNLVSDALAKRDFSAGRYTERSEPLIPVEFTPTLTPDAEHAGLHQETAAADRSDLAGQEPRNAQVSPSTDVTTSRVESESAWPTNKKYDLDSYRRLSVVHSQARQLAINSVEETRCIMSRVLAQVALSRLRYATLWLTSANANRAEPAQF